MILSGNPVSRGIATAPAYLYRPKNYKVRELHIERSQIQETIQQLDNALALAGGELEHLIDSFPAEEAEQAKIFAAHREILRDEELYATMAESIKTDLTSAEYAVDRACEMFVSLLSQVKDDTIAMRIADITDVRNRLIRNLRGEPVQNLSTLSSDCILVAHDLLPSDTASLDRAHILGILTEVGGTTSHTAILARSFQIPAILGVSDALEKIQNGDLLLLDALEGTVTVNPDTAELEDSRVKREAWLKQSAAAETYLCAESRTLDGTKIQIGVNIGSTTDEIPDYADFVGLFRTEFLYMNSDHLPTEEEQFQAYRTVLQKAGGRPVTLRTLDIGGDKQLPYYKLPSEENPFLGKRAIRLCLDELDMFKTQLRAALRASVYGNLWLMFPMVGSMDDIKRLKVVLHQVQEELRASGTPWSPQYKTGIMIEIPSIALIADQAAREVDFASIGTNDLCQYTCAVDRMNPSVAGYYQSLSPAMLRLLHMIVDAFSKAEKPISICGELGGDPSATALLLGLGLRKLSMSQCSIAQVKQQLAKLDLASSEALANAAQQALTELDVKKILQVHNL